MSVVVVSVVLSAQTSDEQRPTFRAGVDVIEIDVSVIDGDGRPITDLEASDFTVTIDGEPRRVVQAPFVSLRPAEPDERREPELQDVFYTSNSIEARGRLIVLAVDEESIPPVTLNIGLYEAFRISEYGDQIVEAAVVARVCSAGLEELVCLPTVRRESALIVEETRFSARNVRRGLESILEGMRDVEGPKALVWVSGGFVIDGSASDLRRIEELAAASRTTLYVIMVDEPLSDVTQAEPAPTPRDDRAMREEGLLAAAALTRGSLFSAHYNPGPVFDRLEAQLSGYYLLGVEVRPIDRNEDRHAIKVSVGRRGARVRARREFRFTSEPDSNDSVDARLARMFRSPVAATELPLRVATYAYPDAESELMRVVVAGEVDARGGVPPALTLRYMLRGPEGTVVGSSTPQQITPTLAQTPDGPVLEFISSIHVEPGTYSLRLAVVDAAGRGGSVEHPVHAERRPSGPLAVGDLLLADQSSAPTGGFRPPVEARVSGGRLLAYTELLADSSAVWSRTQVHVDVAGYSTGPARVQTTATMEGPEDTLHRIVVADVAVAHLPPGRYVARARVMHDSIEVARVLRPFWITESP